MSERPLSELEEMGNRVENTHRMPIANRNRFA
jgi:hypothetical protein